MRQGCIKGVIEGIEQNDAAEEEQVQEPETETESTDTESSESEEASQQTSESGLMYFKPYTVQSGDSLLSICNAEGIDYYSTYRIILAVNGITDANQIYVGQTIMLPTEE